MMNKLGLVSTLLMLPSMIFATNKNFFMPRPPARDLAIDHAGWYQLKRLADNQTNLKVGGSFQALGFYKESIRSTRLGSYFGARNKSNIVYGHGSNLGNDLETEDILHNAIADKFTFTFSGDTFEYRSPSNPDVNEPAGSQGRGSVKKTAGTSTTIAIGDDGPTGIFSTDFGIALEEYDAKKGIPNALKGVISLKPKRKEFGGKFSYYASAQNLWFFKVDIPFLRVEHKLQATISDESAFTDPKTLDRTSLLALITGIYEKQEVADGDNKDLQLPLKWAKINTDKLSEEHIGDIDITLGFWLANAKNYDAALYSRITAPAGSRPTGEYLFEPILGNGGHLELALGTEISMDFWQQKNWLKKLDLEFYLNCNIGYGFKREETRTLGSFIDRGIRLPWQKYMLVAKIGAAEPLQPLANISTVGVDVTPGWKAEALFGVGAKTDWLLIDFGYGFFARAGEKLELDSWNNSGLYSFAPPVRYRTDMVFNTDFHSLDGLDNSAILTSELDVNSAATPPSLYHTIFFSAAYLVQDVKTPVALSIGAQYEFSQDASAAESLGAWLKAGVTF